MPNGSNASTTPIGEVKYATKENKECMTEKKYQNKGNVHSLKS
jgi:hypothetical protein